MPASAAAAATTLAALDHELAHAFLRLSSALEQCRAVEAECVRQVKDIANHRQQLQACKSVRAANLTLAIRFPNVQKQLVEKLRWKLTSLTSALRSHDASSDLCALFSAADASRRRCELLARRISAEQRAAAAEHGGPSAERSPLFASRSRLPPRAVMIEWVSDVSLLFRAYEIRLRRGCDAVDAANAEADADDDGNGIADDGNHRSDQSEAFKMIQLSQIEDYVDQTKFLWMPLAEKEDK